MNSIKVTIMIPTYNQEHFILDALGSALNQDYNNLEIVISDDNSSDNTFNLIKMFLNDKKVKYYKNNTNLGRVKNYNHTLLNYATGDWVINLDGDDYFTDNQFISRAISQIQSIEPSVLGFLSNKYINVNRISTNILKKKIDSNTCVVNGMNFFLNYYKIGGFTHMSFIFNRKSALDLGFYQEDFLASDFISFMKLTLHGDIILSNYQIGIWRLHDDNVSKKNLIIKYIDNNMAISTIASFASSFFSKNDLLKWYDEGLNSNKEILFFDLINSKNRLNQILLLLKNFKNKRIYYIYLIKVLLKKKLSS